MTDTQTLDLLSWRPKGFLPNPAEDTKRLGDQLQRVLDVMRDGKERSLEQLGHDAECPPASASARYRDLKHMGYPVDKRYIRRGLYLYFWISKPQERG